MVVVIDVDTFFKRNDFIHFYKAKLQWPWDSTHFILQNWCIHCDTSINITNSVVEHFVLPMNFDDFKKLYNSSFMWCKFCEYAIYDHFPEDECFCNNH